MCSRFPEEKSEGMEIWAVNRSFTVEPRVDRVYTFDPENLFGPDYISDLAATGVPVYTRSPIEGVPNSIAFPKDRIVASLGHHYSTCTVAWMIQHAIFEHIQGNKIDRLVLNGMYSQRDSVEYVPALPCLNFWCGVAIGLGMRITPYGDCAVMRPYVWESKDYGYITNDYRELAQAAMSAAYKCAFEMPRQFRTAEDMLVPTEDFDSLTQTERQLTQRLAMVRERLAEFSTGTLTPQEQA